MTIASDLSRQHTCTRCHKEFICPVDNNACIEQSHVNAQYKNRNLVCGSCADDLRGGAQADQAQVSEGDKNG